MSAPPPVRPMLVLVLVSWCFRPSEEPEMTEIVIVLSFGSDRPDDRLEIEPSSESAFLANNASSSRSAGNGPIQKARRWSSNSRAPFAAR
jgi:hypothetical protein